MKKALLICLIALSMGACKEYSGYESKSYGTDINENPITNPMYNGPEIITIDSVKYIKSGNQLTIKK